MDFIAEKEVEERRKVTLFENEIRMDNISVHYETFSMKHFSYTFEKGKKYALVGHSGSGKSTVIRLLAGNLEAEEGEITIDGVSLRELDVSNLIACTYQDEHIFRAGYLNNVTLFGTYSDKILCGLEKKLQNPVLDAAAARTAEDNCQDMSGGERQTLIFLRLLLAQTQIVILDEPFSAVDKVTRGIYLDFLFKEMKPDTTLIMVTHDVSEGLDEFDEIIWMEHGAIKKVERQNPKLT